MDQVTRTGRRPSIPPELWSLAFTLYGSGLGYGQVAAELEHHGCWTSRGSVYRLLKGKGCYLGRRPLPP
jgi:hypothetical protein